MKFKTVVGACLLATVGRGMVPEQKPTVTATAITYTEKIRSFSISELQVASALYGTEKRIKLTTVDGCEVAFDADVPRLFEFKPEGRLHLVGDGQPHIVGSLVDYFSNLYFDHAIVRFDDFNLPDPCYEFCGNPAQFVDSIGWVEDGDMGGCPFWAWAHQDSGFVLKGVQASVFLNMNIPYPISVEKGVLTDGLQIKSVKSSSPNEGVQLTFGHLTGSGDVSLIGANPISLTVLDMSGFTGRIILSGKHQLSLPGTDLVPPVGSVARLVQDGVTRFFDDLTILYAGSEHPTVEVLDPSRLTATARPYVAADGRMLLDWPYGCEPVRKPVTYKLDSYTSPSSIPVLREGDTLILNRELTEDYTFTAVGKVYVEGGSRSIDHVHFNGGDIHYRKCKASVTEVPDARCALFADPERWVKGEVSFGKLKENPVSVALGAYGNTNSTIAVKCGQQFRLAGGEDGEIRIDADLIIDYGSGSEFQIIGTDQPRVSFASVNIGGSFRLSSETPCAMRIEKLAGYGDVSTTCPLSFGAQECAVGSVGDILISKGAQVEFSWGNVLEGNGTLRVDGTLTLSNTATARCAALSGTGTIVDVGGVMPVQAKVVARRSEGYNVFNYLSLAAAVADGALEKLEILDPTAKAPWGYKVETVDGVSRLVKNPFRGLIVIAR